MDKKVIEKLSFHIEEAQKLIKILQNEGEKSTEMDCRMQKWFEKYGDFYSKGFNEWRLMYQFFCRTERLAIKDYSVKQFKIDLDAACVANGYLIFEQRGNTTGNPLEIKLVKND